VKTSNGALVDLLDRLLDRGVCLKADIVITVAGVPLVGLSLQALIGAVDRLVEYGVWSATDPLVGVREEAPAIAAAVAAGTRG
jgi:hypothetical protein